jgi:replication factor A1
MSISSASSFEVNPDRPEVHELRGWYETEGKNATVSRPAGGGGGGGGRSDRRIVISQVKDENLGANEDKADWFIFKGSVSFIKKSEKSCYKACPSESCNKKLIEVCYNLLLVALYDSRDSLFSIAPRLCPRRTAVINTALLRASEQDGDEFRCEKCNKAYKDYEYRIMMSLSALDQTSQLWVSCFSETAEIILGETAKKMGTFFQPGVFVGPCALLLRLHY